MAKVVDQMPGGSGHRKDSKYDRFLDGQVWLLERGIDFDRKTKPTSVGFGLRLVAKKRGQTVRVRIDGDRVYVQAVALKEQSNGEGHEG